MREVANRWRVDDDWWRAPISRTYLVVRTPTALEIYCDGIVGDWYLQRGSTSGTQREGAGET